MDFVNQLIFVGAVLMVFSVLAGQMSSRVGAPLLLTFLLVGIFCGEDGPIGIIFNDKEIAYVVSSLALAIILFDGGLRTPLRNFQSVLRPALLLSTVGVLLTAIITAFFASWLLGINLLSGLLIGSIVASTDAAAVFLLLRQRGIYLKERVNAALEVESGINDPMAIFLTISCVEMMTGEITPTTTELIFLFIRQMGLGIALGYAGGIALARLMTGLKLDVGLYPVLVLMGGLAIFGGTNLVEGSGFLAVYIAGITFSNCGLLNKTRLIKQFHNGLAWISQLVMMLVLGLLVTPSNLVHYIWPALGVATALILVARPVAVWLCLIGSHFNWQEKTFISWVGLRGAIPIYLALIPALTNVRYGHYYFNIAFIIVLASLIVQGWSINGVAKKLKLTDPSQSPRRHNQGLIL